MLIYALGLQWHMHTFSPSLHEGRIQPAINLFANNGRISNCIICLRAVARHRVVRWAAEGAAVVKLWFCYNARRMSVPPGNYFVWKYQHEKYAGLSAFLCSKNPTTGLKIVNENPDFLNWPLWSFSTRYSKQFNCERSCKSKEYHLVGAWVEQ